MAKRVQCLDIWDKDWFIHLDDHYKLFYQYIEDNCSEAGIWAPQKARFEGLLKQKKQIDYYKFLEDINAEGERIVILKNGNWLLKHYFSDRQGSGGCAVINIQQGFHRRVIKDLIFHEALDKIVGVMNIEEAVINFNAFNQERKRISQQKLRATTGIDIVMEPNAGSPAEDISGAPVPPEPIPITERKIQIAGRSDSFLFPEITYYWDGTPQAIELEKFLRVGKFELFCKVEKITEAALLKGVLEEFAGKIIKEASRKEFQTSDQLEVWFYRWYNTVKGNMNFMQKFKKKSIEDKPKIPQFRKANSPPT